MNTQPNRSVAKNHSARLHTESNRFFQGTQVLAAVCLGAAASTAYGVVDVQVNDALNTHLDKATAAEHEFNLLGNVAMNGATLINRAARQNIFIEGNGNTITKKSNDHIFWINNWKDASLTIRNANITSANTGASYGTIYVDSGSTNALIDLDGTSITGTKGHSGIHGGALTTHAANTRVKGNVTFGTNYATGDGGGAVAVGTKADLTFEDKTTFTANYTENYGGAISVREGGSLTFKDKATFTGNYATKYFGGAIDAWNGAGSIVLESGGSFTGNYVKNTSAQSYGVRGGAINVGYVKGTDSPQLRIDGVSEFTGNYVWGYGKTVAIGGALSLSSAGADPLGHGNIVKTHIYGASIEQGIFTNNYAYSDTGDGYGGAVFSRSYDSTVSFGSGSTFTGNMAKTLGGAIYFDQGTLNLKGNVSFSGNRQYVNFSTAGGVLTPDANSGKANAIYFAVSGNTATLNLSNDAGEVIRFADPIESASGKTVAVNKTGLGKVIFTDNNSDILAKTIVGQGTFELGEGAGYGRSGNAANSFFRLDSGATLKGGANATLRASAIGLSGRIEVNKGQFNLEGADVMFSETSVLALVINSIDDYSSITVNTDKLELDNAFLEITATNYVPSQNISDEFTIVSGFTEKATGMFIQGEYVVINGAEFQIHYNKGSITLQQLSVPEPSTYALILGAGAMAMLYIRRRKR